MPWVAALLAAASHFCKDLGIGDAVECLVELALSFLYWKVQVWSGWLRHWGSQRDTNRRVLNVNVLRLHCIWNGLVLDFRSLLVVTKLHFLGLALARSREKTLVPSQASCLNYNISSLAILDEDVLVVYGLSNSDLMSVRHQIMSESVPAFSIVVNIFDLFANVVV